MKFIYCSVLALGVTTQAQVLPAQESAEFATLSSCLAATPFTKDKVLRQAGLRECLAEIIESCWYADFQSTKPEDKKVALTCFEGMSAEVLNQMHNVLSSEYPTQNSFGYQLRKMELDYGQKRAELNCDYVRT